MPSWRSVSPIFPGFRAYLKSSSAMKIMDVQWYSYRLPLLNSFTTAHGVMTAPASSIRRGQPCRCSLASSGPGCAPAREDTC